MRAILLKFPVGGEPPNFKELGIKPVIVSRKTGQAIVIGDQELKEKLRPLGLDPSNAKYGYYPSDQGNGVWVTYTGEIRDTRPEKGGSKGGGRPRMFAGEPTKEVFVTIPTKDIDYASKLGDGSVSKGVHVAIEGARGADQKPSEPKPDRPVRERRETKDGDRTLVW